MLEPVSMTHGATNQRHIKVSIPPLFFFLFHISLILEQLDKFFKVKISITIQCSHLFHYGPNTNRVRI